MKRILLTGASGGMGKSTLEYLANEGYFIYALDIADIPKMDNVLSFKVDLRNMDEITRVYEEIKSSGELDAIIHLSGTFKLDSYIEIEEKDLLKVFDINFFAVYRVNKVFLPLLHRGSKIIITSSEVAPLDPLPFNGIYSVSKTTLEKYAESLRQELNLLDIPVVIVRPGAVDTGMIPQSLKDVEALENKTTLYKENSKKFMKIVKSNESKTIKPIKIAKLMSKILKKKKPKLVYKINHNIKLKLLSMLPKRMQLFIIKQLIK